MADFRTYFDNDFLADWDLGGQEAVVTIARVAAGTVQNKGGHTRKIILHFSEAAKGMIANKTNARIIASLYGTDTSQWIGRRVTLFPTTTEMEGETRGCIRVRGAIPQLQPSPSVGVPAPPVESNAPGQPGGPAAIAPMGHAFGGFQQPQPPLTTHVVGRDAPPAARRAGTKAQREEARRGR